VIADRLLAQVVLVIGDRRPVAAVPATGDRLLAEVGRLISSSYSR
jgi:hypothetical protein